MKTDRYLGELGAALRLRLSDERTAEIVAEIAGHIDASGNDPMSELGEPNNLARDLLAAEQSSRGRVVRIAVFASVCMFVTLLGFALLIGGSPLEINKLIPQMMLAILIGGVSLAYGGRVRSALRTGDARILGIGVAVMTALILVGIVIQELVGEWTMDVPWARWIGAIMMIVGFGASFLIHRPLKFAAESGLRTNGLGLLKYPEITSKD